MNLFTQSGVFSTDDVFAAALIKLVAKKENKSLNIHIYRGIEFLSLITKEDISYGFEGAAYDYKVKQARREDDGSLYANLGLIWKDFGHLFLQRPEVLDETLIWYLDHAEVTGEPNLLSTAIRSFNPTYRNAEKLEECFLQAVSVAEQILEKEIAKLSSIEDVEKVILEGKIYGDILYLNSYVPYTSHLELLDKEINFVIYQHLNKFVCKPVKDNTSGGYKIPFYDGSEYKVAETLDKAVKLCNVKRLES